MKKLALVLATAATLAVTVVATPSPAHARYYGYGPDIFGGLLAGALIHGVVAKDDGLAVAADVTRLHKFREGIGTPGCTGQVVDRNPAVEQLAV